MEERKFNKMVKEIESFAKGWENDYRKFVKRYQAILEEIKKSEGVKLLAESEIKPYVERCKKIVKELEKIYKNQ
ncbi:hypothetical protein J7M02_06510 [Candidatus Aerophobetes bacterium]|nr:hypothetical protein [Candidatus Aerophobetes bacterium]